MWPSAPDDFFPEIQPPDTLDELAVWYFIFLDGKIVSVSDQGMPRPVTGDEFRWLDLDVQQKIYLGRYRERACFALSAQGDPGAGYPLLDLRGWLGRVDQALFYLAGRAQQILDWDRDHRFCGRCGSPMQPHRKDRARECGNCGLISYPRISPSIIVLVTRGEDLLLARNANWPEGMYSTLAGFVEPGESVEQTVHREVMEEVALEIRNLRYLGSQSWPFPNSLMLGYHADYHAGEIRCQVDEIADAQWFHYTELPHTPPRTAISGWLIEDYVKQLQERRPASD